MTPAQFKMTKAALLVSALMIFVGFMLLGSTENMLVRAGVGPERDAAVIRKKQFEIAGPVLMAAGALGIVGTMFIGGRLLDNKK